MSELVARLDTTSEDELGVCEPDDTGRSGKPPSHVYYVVWGQGRLNKSHLYRDRGWAERRASGLTKKGYFVRVHEAKPIEWHEYECELDNLAAHRLLAWAANEKWRLALLELNTDIPIARFLMNHPGWNETTTRLVTRVHRMRRFFSRRSPKDENAAVQMDSANSGAS